MRSSNTCESCHNALTKDWYSITGIDHGDVIAGTCKSCHKTRKGAAYGTTKPDDHIDSSNTCDNCHLTAGVAWKGAVDQEAAPLGNVAVPASAALSTEKLIKTGEAEPVVAALKASLSDFIHPDVSESCSGCHDGLIAKGQAINHIKTTLTCDDCHSQKNWVPVIRVDHVATMGSCFSCHNRKIAEGKPINHISSDNNCDNCHVTQLWSQVVMDHSNVTGSCSICHNGKSAPNKPVNHIASGNTCDDCHRRRAWTPVYRVDHLSVFGKCSSCHNGKVAEGKPVNHPNTDNNCEECHRSNLWSLVTFNHENVAGTCVSCHITDYKQQRHKKTTQVPPVYYTVNELSDCSDSCHVYSDQTFSTISIRRPGPDHRPERGAW